MTKTYIIGPPALSRMIAPTVAASHSLSPPASLSHLENYITRKVPRGANVLVIAPRRRSAKSLLPAAVIDDRVISLLFAEKHEHLASWLSGIATLKTAEKKHAVLAEWDDHYLKVGRHWLRALTRHPQGRTENWMADKVGGDRLIEKINRGARLCAYFGHGHTEGLSGYHGVYYDDILAYPAQASVSSFLSFACQHLAQPFGARCFGKELVAAGRVAAFWGATCNVKTDANEKLARIGVQTLCQTKVKTIADWMRSVDKQVLREDDQQVLQAWRQYRLVGLPSAAV